jgi:hypothetical protein
MHGTGSVPITTLKLFLSAHLLSFLILLQCLDSFLECRRRDEDDATKSIIVMMKYFLLQTVKHWWDELGCNNLHQSCSCHHTKFMADGGAGLFAGRW